MAKVKRRVRPLKNVIPACVYQDKELMDLVIIYQDKSVCRIPLSRLSKEFVPRSQL